MAQYGSEAYDLSLFEKKKPAITALPKKETKAEKRRNSLRKVMNGTVVLTVAVLIVTVITFMIGTQISLTEQNNLINQEQTVLRDMQSEVKRLESELAAQTSAQSVEEYAESVGLRKMESGQIDYITVPEDEITQADEEGGLWETILNAVKAWIY